MSWNILFYYIVSSSSYIQQECKRLPPRNRQVHTAVFHAGPSVNMNWFNIDGDGSQTPAGTRAGGSDQMNGNAVMYDSGKILTVAGAPSRAVQHIRVHSHLRVS